MKSRYHTTASFIIITLLGLSGCETTVVDLPGLQETVQVSLTDTAHTIPAAAEITPATGETQQATDDLLETGADTASITDIPQEASPVPLPDTPYLEAVTHSLITHFNLAEDSLQVLSIEAVEWPDASLGCPLPGVNYAEVITPGFIIRVDARDITYIFHTDQFKTVVLCTEDGTPLLPSIPIPTGEKIMDGEPWMPVD